MIIIIWYLYGINSLWLSNDLCYFYNFISIWIDVEMIKCLIS